MRINTTARINNTDPDLNRHLKEIGTQINKLSEGSMSALYGARTSVPTTGEWAQGDFVANSLPEELGSVASKYVIVGWRYVNVGAGVLDWVEAREFTGN